MSIFKTKPIEALMSETADGEHSLKRVLGADKAGLHVMIHAIGDAASFRHGSGGTEMMKAIERLGFDSIHTPVGA